MFLDAQARVDFIKFPVSKTWFDSLDAIHQELYLKGLVGLNAAISDDDLVERIKCVAWVEGNTKLIEYAEFRLSNASTRDIPHYLLRGMSRRYNKIIERSKLSINYKPFIEHVRHEVSRIDIADEPMGYTDEQKYEFKMREPDLTIKQKRRARQLLITCLSFRDRKLNTQDALHLQSKLQELAAMEKDSLMLETIQSLRDRRVVHTSMESWIKIGLNRRLRNLGGNING